MGKEPRVWQRMLSGRRLDLLNPSPFDVELDDIAHGLARVARWNGQTSGPHIFSVAQHSLLVEAVAVHLRPAMPRDWRLAVLLHDAPEYVIGDIISPFKAVIGDAYKAIESRLLAAIHVHFGLQAESDALCRRLVKKADRQAAFHEATRLAGFGRQEALKFFGRPDPLPKDVLALLEPWPIERAEAAYREAVARATSATLRI
jgi:5'-deoxynucleotidase YfbR-like HD superfamily hydrolase